jgi:hypothetical protein
MDEAIRNFGPVVVLWLVALFAWLEVRRMHRKRHLPGEDPAE